MPVANADICFGTDPRPFDGKEGAEWVDVLSDCSVGFARDSGELSRAKHLY